MNYKKILIGIALTTVTLTACGFRNNNAKLVEDTYTVQQGDTLWLIAGKYVEKNTCGSRDVREFISGIVELNYDRIFKGREPALIYPGDELRINYWTTMDKRGDEVDTE